MSLPIGEVGVGAISGGTLVVFAMKLLPILLRKINGKNRANINNAKPGSAKICRDRGEKIAQHDTTIKHLCELSDKAGEQVEVARKENRQDHKEMLAKLSELGK